MGGAAPRGSVAHRQTLAVRYRAAREDEVDVALDLFLDALTDMLRRNGIDPGELHRQEWQSAYHHVFRTGLFRVAELEGRMAAICHAIVRGPLWLLSGYWTRPGLQGQGVGGPLLAAVWEEGRARGATTFFTWSSIDLTATAACLKRGMLPGYQILSFAGPLVRLRALGANHVSIRFALGAGLRLAGYSHLLTTAPFGTLERYVPSGPTLF